MAHINPETVEADYVELAIRDQYMSRSDMWRIKQAMVGQCVYASKKMSFPGGLRVHIREIVRGHRKAACGYITHQTKTIFRSESAHVYLLLQLSREMTEFVNGDSDLCFEKVVHDFLPDLFARWTALKVNHLVTIVLFSRVLYDDASVRATEAADASSTMPPGFGRSGAASFGHYDFSSLDGVPRIFPEAINSSYTATPLSISSSGQRYRDVYKVLIDAETRADWTTVLGHLKAEYHRFISNALLVNEGGVPVVRGELAPAHLGNLLEAVNLALNPHDKHYVDRKLDFVRTGLSIQIVTAGTGYLETDKRLLRLTTQRMLDNGVALDLVCMSPPPLHATPLFLITSKFPYAEHHGEEPRTSRSAIAKDRRAESWDPVYYDDDKEDNPEYLFFTVPDWIDVSYYYAADPLAFNVRARMPSLTLNTVDQLRVNPVVPYLDPADLEGYDDAIFSRPEAPAGGAALKQNMYRLRFALDASTRPPSHSAFTMVMSDEDGGGGGAGTGVGGAAGPNASAHLSTSFTMTTSPHGNLPRASSDSSLLIPVVRSKHVPIMSTSPASASYMARAAAAHSFRRTGLETMAEMAASRRTNESMHARLGLRESYESGVGAAAAMSGMASAPGPGVVIGPAAGGGGGGGGGYHSHLEPIPDADDHSMPVSVTRGGLPGSGAGVGVGPTSPMGQSPRRANQFLAGSQLTRMAGMNDSSQRGSAFGASGSGVATGGLAGTNPTSQLYPAPPLSQCSHQPAAVPASHYAIQLRPNLISPWSPKRNVVKLSSHLQRWHHVYPQTAAYRVAAPLWNSLCTPACLPITTDSFPTAEELMDLYQEYTYTVSPNEFGDPAAPAGGIGIGIGNSSVADPTGQSAPGVAAAEALLAEMISLRLAQGFQIVLSSGPTHAPGASGLGGGVARDTFMSMGHHLHKLSLSADHCVEVKRYVRRLDYLTRSIQYKMSLWSRDEAQFVNRSTTFNYPQLAMFNWNFVDHLISGYDDDDDDMDTYHMFRARFVFIPMDHVPASINTTKDDSLDEEELRIAGFMKLMETMQKHVTDGTPLRVQITSLTRSAHIRSEIAARERELEEGAGSAAAAATAPPGVPAGYPLAGTSVSTRGLFAHGNGSSSGGGSGSALQSLRRASSAGIQPERPSRESKPTAIAYAMQHPAHGVKFSDRRWHLKLYERVFIGSEAVDWMLRALPDVETREDAVAFGNALLKAGIFIHVLKRHGFPARRRVSI
ncbi:vacuolar membrane-associated protein iml1 [Blastocladiella emersonii ATCC 22665]|nr:vacuolar membrane-associated protein iml1 [Blastocladiella emersonii ATCC 22665]